jgi:hypothetical protein
MILKDSLSRLAEAQDLEDQLARERQTNQKLLDQVNALTSQLEDEKQRSQGRLPYTSFVIMLVFDMFLNPIFHIRSCSATAQY